MPTSQQRGPANFTQADGITLKEYIDLRFDQAQMALEIAKKANELHFDQLNKFREALQDQTNTYVSRNELELKLERWVSEYRTAHEVVCRDIENLEKFQTVIETKASHSSVIWAYVIAGIGVLISLWDFVSHLTAP